MATRIRLRRVGRKGQSYFRIVVADQRAPRDGRAVATLGHYDPRVDPAKIDVNKDQALAWLAKGATPRTRCGRCSRRPGCSRTYRVVARLR
jgi:small subunit ribosomal protein S16